MMCWRVAEGLAAGLGARVVGRKATPRVPPRTPLVAIAVGRILYLALLVPLVYSMPRLAGMTKEELFQEAARVARNLGVAR